MKPVQHVSAKASYYNTRAQYYDAFNEASAQPVNAFLAKILKEHSVYKVLDLSCGTGSQVFYLKELGFEVVGIDINAKMLKIAKQKAKAKHLKIKFLQGDCRNSQVGEFDAVITIFNAIGHLSREDFHKALWNINQNLKPGGLYVFDIFNRDYLQHENNITKLTIDWMTELKGNRVREIQFSTITAEGVLASYSTYVRQAGYVQPPQLSRGYVNTLQVYTAEELSSLLKQSGFTVLTQTGMQGEVFLKESTERIWTLAQKL